MASYTVEQHVQMIKIYYQNECSLVRTLRALRPFYGRRGGPSRSTLQRLVTKFETTGSVNNQSTPLRQRNARSAENIAAVRESVQEIPRQSISHRAQELGLSQTSTWRILRGDLGLHPTERHSDTESQTNEDSSDTNITAPAPVTASNHLDSGTRAAGQHVTSGPTSFSNGLDRSSPARDISAKQKSFNSSAKKNNNKKARHR